MKITLPSALFVSLLLQPALVSSLFLGNNESLCDRGDICRIGVIFGRESYTIHKTSQGGITCRERCSGPLFSRFFLNFGWECGPCPKACFQSNQELKNAVDFYLSSLYTPETNVGLRYGHPIGEWCVEELDDFSGVFDASRNSALSTFNLDITRWNTTSATNFSYMFANTNVFNRKIGIWDTSNVVSMSGMFSEALSFDQSLDDWNTELVEDLSFMFNEAVVFNQNISSWNTSNVKTLESMFARADAFNQNLTGWDTSNVTNFNDIFLGAESFNGRVDTWDTSSATTMVGTFREARNFAGNVSDWVTDKVTNMQSMFLAADSFNSDLSSWVTSNVEDMSFMFAGADLFDQPLASWDTANVERMSNMFRETPFNQDISGWNTAKVRGTGGMFLKCTHFNQDLSWNMSNNGYMGEMFRDNAVFDGSLSFSNMDNVASMSRMFDGATSYTGKNLDTWNPTSVNNYFKMFKDSALASTLCAWSTIMKPNANVTQMFDGSQCSDQRDPVYESSKFEPLCTSICCLAKIDCL